MYNVKLYNKISKVGLDDLDAAKYTCSEDFTDYDAVLVRSAKLHEVEFPKDLKCIARAGAGVNNIPIDRCSQEGIVVFNTPGANANAVKELVICALLLASRKVVQGANWVKGLKGTPDIGPAAEKGKSTYAGPEIAGKKLGIIGLGAIGVKVANAAVGLDMEVWGVREVGGRHRFFRNFVDTGQQVLHRGRAVRSGCHFCHTMAVCPLDQEHCTGDRRAGVCVALVDGQVGALVILQADGGVPAGEQLHMVLRGVQDMVRYGGHLLQGVHPRLQALPADRAVRPGGAVQIPGAVLDPG